MVAVTGEAAYPRVPDGSRIYAIGDIHGRKDLLDDLHGQIVRESASAALGRRVVIYLGDYVDRGPDARGVTEALLNDPVPGFETRHLMGNHEDMLLRFLGGEDICEAWLVNGGGATLVSYGLSTGMVLAAAEDWRGDGAMAALRDAFAEALPAPHRRFYQKLRRLHAEGDYLFVHAGIRPGVALERQRDADLMWIRDPFLQADADFGAVVVHGHSITATPQIRHNRIGIDTGAYASGRLTCLVLEGGDRWFLST